MRELDRDVESIDESCGGARLYSPESFLPLRPWTQYLCPSCKNSCRLFPPVNTIGAVRVYPGRIHLRT